MTKSKKNILRIGFIAISITCTAIFTPWIFLRIWITPLPDTVQEQVDQAMNYGLDGMIVYVDQQGHEPEFYASGWKNRENKVPVKPDDLFKIASISKLYIAAATVKLVYEQRLALDKTLAEYLTDLAQRIEYADQITLRMLIQHRSGIPNFTDDPDFPWNDPPKGNMVAVAPILDKPADFKPNARYSYSNTNYVLIGEIMDRTLGYSHHQYIKETILDPLGLTHTFGTLSDVDPEKVTSGYHVGYEPDVKMNDYSLPGGSMVATAEEVGIFLRALIDGTLLTDEEQAIYSEVYGYEHTGLLPGYQSIARYHADVDAVVIEFTNTSGAKSWTIAEILYKRIVRILGKR